MRCNYTNPTRQRGFSPSPLVGEGRGEGLACCSLAGTGTHSAASPPHPNPLPRGEREPELARISLAAMLVGMLVLLVGSAAAADSTDPAQRLASLAPEQKEELLRKKERFDALPAGERERLRELHTSLSAAPNSPALSQTLDRYCEWLKTLSSAQRAELKDMPAEKRIERIKELLKQQENQRFQEYAAGLPPEDRDTINRWLDEFVMRNEEEILQRLPSDMRRRLSEAPDDEARRRMLIMPLQYRRSDSDMPLPTREDFDKLLASLSPTTKKQLEQAKTPEERQSRTRDLVRAAIFSRFFPPVSDEELRKFYTSLPTESRERLEAFDHEQMTRELRRMYYYEKFRERGGGGPWTGFGGPRPGPGGPGRTPSEGRGDNKGSSRFGPGNSGGSRPPGSFPGEGSGERPFRGPMGPPKGPPSETK